MYRFLKSWPVAVALFGCVDPIQAPVVVSISIDPPAVLSGGQVRLRSASFRDIELYPTRGIDGFFTVPNRWENFVVALGGDTADVWREDDSTLVALLPPRQTGQYSISCTLDGAVLLDEYIQIVGVAREPLWVFNDMGYLAGVEDIIEIRAGLALAYDYLGPVVLDLRRGVTSEIHGLRFPGPYGSGMVAPGQSYIPGEFILDLRDSTHTTTGWRILPRLEQTAPSGCSGAGTYRYSVSQIGPGKCLTMRDSDWRAEIYADSVTPLTVPNYGLAGGRLISTPDGKWTVPIGRIDLYNERPEMHRWPVFNDVPVIEYTLDRYDRVTAAAFGNGGDTLFLAVDTDFSNSRESWRVDALRTTDGGVLTSREIETDRILALKLDPIFPWVFVAGYDSANRSVKLEILHRETLGHLASIETPPGFWWPDFGVLVNGGSEGVVYLWTYDAHWSHSRIVAFDVPPELIGTGPD